MVCSAGEGKPFAKYLNSKGISAVVVFYRVKNKALYPNPQDDLAKAVAYVVSKAQEWNLDMEHYSVWGSSAGGHLVGSFGTKNMGYGKYQLPKPNALVLTYPVVTMTELTHEQTRSNLLGTKPTREQIAFASIEQNITEEYPDTFVWCGDADNTVDHRNSQMLASALEEKGVRHKLIEYPNVDHGVGLGAGLACEGWIEEAVKFWLGA